MSQKGKKKNAAGKIVLAFIVMAACAAIVLVGYYQLNKRKGMTEEKDIQPRTEIGRLEAKDLELEYPETPTEVVKLFWRLNKCIYNRSMREKDLKLLFEQLRMLYDEEFLASEGNSYEDMLAALKKDKEEFKREKRMISSYLVDGEKKVEHAELDGKECATLMSSILETAGSKNTQTYAEFICRRDGDGRWKILGWERTSADSQASGDKDR